MAPQQLQRCNKPDPELGDPRNPVRVLTGLFLAPGSQVSVRCVDEFTVDGPVTMSYIPVPSKLTCCDFHAALPCYDSMKITVPDTGKKTKISPTAPLTTAFGAGWSQLPIELKDKIVGPSVVHMTPVPRPLQSGTETEFTEHIVGVHNAEDSFKKYVMPWAKITPEMGTVATRLYYENNSFVIRGYTAYHANGTQDKPKLPPKAAAKFIHDLTYELSLDWPSWNLMGRIAKRELGFKKILRVNVWILSRQAQYSLPNMLPWERQKFSATIRRDGPKAAAKMITHGEKVEFAGKGAVFIENIEHMVIAGAGSDNRSLAEFWGCEWMQNQFFNLVEKSISFEKE